MKVLASAEESGAIKLVVFPIGTDTSKQTAPQPSIIKTFNAEGRDKAVQQMIMVTVKDKKYIAVARKGGYLQLLNVPSADIADTEGAEIVNDWFGCANSATDAIVSLVCVGHLLITCSSEGLVCVHDLSNLDTKDIFAKLQVTGPVSSFVNHYETSGIFALGGKERDLEIIQLWEETKKPLVASDLKVKSLWKAKNVKNNSLDLRVPVWITGIQFLKEEPRVNQWSILTVTRYGQVRLYDTAHGRRPMSSNDASKYPISSVAESIDSNQVIISDTHSTTLLFDTELKSTVLAFRPAGAGARNGAEGRHAEVKGKLVGKFAGATGAVQSLHSYLKANVADVHGDSSIEQPLVAAGGLDRYLRVFDLKTRECISKIYMSAEITAVWIIEGNENDKPSLKKRRKDAEVEDEELWETLQEGVNGESAPAPERKVKKVKVSKMVLSEDEE